MGLPARVLHVIGAMDRGGAESLIMNVYRTIDRQRIQFDFLVHEQRKCDFDEEIEQMGGKLFRLPRFNGINYCLYSRLCNEFFKLNHNYCAVHVHIGSCAALVIRSAKKYGLYCIAHSHNTNPPISVMELGFRVFSHPTRYLADYYLACSEQAGVDRFGRGVVDGGKFSVLNNGIELSKYHFNPEVRSSYRQDLGIEPSIKAVCHIGRFSQQKNHLFLIRAFALALQENASLKLFLAGRGPLEKEVKSLVESLGISESVIFLGVRDDVPSLLMGMDLFVLPSRWEGFGIVAIEAQASGLPCLLSPELPDIAFCAPYAKRIAMLEDPSAWAGGICKTRPRIGDDRVDGVDFVRSAGFDIVDVSSLLQSLYLRHEIEND